MGLEPESEEFLVIEGAAESEAGSDRSIDDRQNQPVQVGMAQGVAEKNHERDENIASPGLESEQADLFRLKEDAVDVLSGDPRKPEAVDEEARSEAEDDSCSDERPRHGRQPVAGHDTKDNADHGPHSPRIQPQPAPCDGGPAFFEERDFSGCHSFSLFRLKQLQPTPFEARRAPDRNAISRESARDGESTQFDSLRRPVSTSKEPAPQPRGCVPQSPGKKWRRAKERSARAPSGPGSG